MCTVWNDVTLEKCTVFIFKLESFLPCLTGYGTTIILKPMKYKKNFYPIKM